MSRIIALVLLVLAFAVLAEAFRGHRRRKHARRWIAALHGKEVTMTRMLTGLISYPPGDKAMPCTWTSIGSSSPV